MTKADANNTTKVSAQFISCTNGQLFSLLYTPTHKHRIYANTAILYFPPFAEELNKSRRMVSLQAQRFCKVGYTVLIVDLFGTGDSEGDFAQVNWKIWQQNMCMAVRWLQDKGYEQLIFWSLRLGAFLAVQTAASMPVKVVKFIFWQPVVQGKMLLTQFLRLRMAADFISGNDKISPTDLRQQLYNGHNVEIAGYSISPDLAQTIDGLDFKTTKPRFGSKVFWLEILPSDARNVSPHNEGIIIEWGLENIEIEVNKVVGQPFWNSLEIVELPTLLELTAQHVL